MKGKKMTPERLAELRAEMKASKQTRKNINKNQALTIEALKEAKSEIIKEITYRVGATEIKAVMTKMVAMLKTTEATCEMKLASDAMCELGYFNHASERMAEINKESGIKIMQTR